MARIEPLVATVLSDLARGLRALHVNFCVVGALAPELLLDVTPPRKTNETDATVIVESLAEFE